MLKIIVGIAYLRPHRWFGPCLLEEPEQDLLTIESDYPDVIELLQRIDEEERQHRDKYATCS